MRNRIVCCLYFNNSERPPLKKAEDPDVKSVVFRFFYIRYNREMKLFSEI